MNNGIVYIQVPFCESVERGMQRGGLLKNGREGAQKADSALEAPVGHPSCADQGAAHCVDPTK